MINIIMVVAVIVQKLIICKKFITQNNSAIKVIFIERRENIMYWTKEEYIKNRTEYWREERKGVKMSLKLAKKCAEEDWESYLEKYEYNDKKTINK